MNIDRLNRLIEVLNEVQERRKAFDMSAWMSGLKSPTTTYGEVEPCGTTACALGYAALDPVLQSQGLSLVARCHTADENGYLSSYDKCENRVINTANDFNEALNRYAWVVADPVYNGSSGFVTGARFFDISINASYFLFDPDEYNNGSDRVIEPIEVIRRIEYVLANAGQIPTNEEG